MFIRTSILIALFLIVTCPAQSAGIRVVTEDWSPYNYTEDGEIKGMATEVVRAVLDRAGLDYTIETLPWARAYKLAQTEPDVLIYSILKLPNRAPLFKWIQLRGLSIDMYLFRPKYRNDINLGCLEEAKAYKVGVTRETSTHHFLLAKGFKAGVNLFPVNCEQFNALKSQPHTKRIDLTTGNSISLARELKVAGLPPDYWVRQVLLFKKDLYMAFSLSTSDATVERVRTAFEEVRAQGTLDAVVNRYCHMFE